MFWLQLHIYSTFRKAIISTNAFYFCFSIFSGLHLFVKVSETRESHGNFSPTLQI